MGAAYSTGDGSLAVSMCRLELAVHAMHVCAYKTTETAVLTYQHRDLKPDNVLLSANQRVVRLTDLGISKRLESCSDQLLASCSGARHFQPWKHAYARCPDPTIGMHTFVIDVRSFMEKATIMMPPMQCTLILLNALAGTPGYMPPEALACRPATTAGDVWALGCVLYEMTTRQPAFTAHGLPQVFTG